MIVEFEAHPDNWTGRMEWRGKRAVDMCWVAAVEPWEYRFLDQHLTGTSMLLCGGQAWFSVNMPYSDVMALWVKAKGGVS